MVGSRPTAFVSFEIGLALLVTAVVGYTFAMTKRVPRIAGFVLRRVSLVLRPVSFLPAIVKLALVVTSLVVHDARLAIAVIKPRIAIASFTIASVTLLVEVPCFIHWVMSVMAATVKLMTAGLWSVSSRRESYEPRHDAQDWVCLLSKCPSSQIDLHSHLDDLFVGHDDLARGAPGIAGKQRELALFDRTHRAEPNGEKCLASDEVGRVGEIQRKARGVEKLRHVRVRTRSSTRCVASGLGSGGARIGRVLRTRFAAALARHVEESSATSSSGARLPSSQGGIAVSSHGRPPHPAFGSEVGVHAASKRFDN